MHVHRVFLLFFVTTQKLTLGRAFVEYLHVLDGVVGQVFEHHLVLALEEVGAVQRQVLHLLAVDVNLAVLLQFHARQLLDESVEHRALGNVEGVSIENDGVAFVHHLYLCGLDDHFVQFTTVLVDDALGAFHANGRHLELTVTGYVFYFVVFVGCLIARSRCLDDILGRLGGYLHIPFRRLNTSPAVIVYLCRVHQRRVRAEQHHLRVGDVRTGERVRQVAVQINLLFFFYLC